MILAFRLAPWVVLFASMIWAVPVLDNGWSFLLGMAVGMFSMLCNYLAAREHELRRWYK